MSDNSKWEVEHRDFIITFRVVDLARTLAEVRRKDRSEILHHEHGSVGAGVAPKDFFTRRSDLTASQVMIQKCEDWIDKLIRAEGQILVELIRYRGHKLTQKRKRT